MAEHPVAIAAYANEAARRALQKATTVALGPDGPYWTNPVLFAETFLPSLDLDPHQQRTLATLATEGRLAARALRGAGKSTTAAVAIIWFAVTREAAGLDWKVITTASKWRQLQKFLWPEVRKWAPKLDWSALGLRPWQRGTELLDMGIKLTHGEASAVQSNDPEAIEGAHADNILVIVDEAKAVPDESWNAMEGWLSTGRAMMLAVSTPGVKRGRFYEIFVRRAGLEDWATDHVTLAEVVAAGRVKPEWAERLERLWGADSPFYRQQVLAEFADVNEDGVIPIDWIEAAVERWQDLNGRPTVPASHAAADIARHGSDANVLAIEHGDLVLPLETWHTPDLMVTTDRLSAQLNLTGRPPITVDADGMGAGVLDRLRQLGFDARAFHGAPKTEWKDRSGELRFFNTRTAAWWSLREQLNPAHTPTLALPPDDELIADLAAPKWDLTRAGEVRVEDKALTKSRLGRSPDKGDAIVYLRWVPPQEPPPPPESAIEADGWKRSDAVPWE